MCLVKIINLKLGKFDTQISHYKCKRNGDKVPQGSLSGSRDHPFKFWNLTLERTSDLVYNVGSCKYYLTGDKLAQNGGWSGSRDPF